MQKIKQFFLWLYDQILNFREIQKHKKWQKLLAKGIIDRKQETIRIMQDIKGIIISEKLKRQTSLFIPLTRKSNEEIRYMVLAKHGKYMKDLNIKLSHELKFI